MAKKKENLEIEGLDENEAGEPRVYELGFHLDPELPQEEVKKTYQAIRDAIAAAGTVIAEGEPTKIPLAYTMYRSDTSGRRDFDSAFFCWIAYEADGAGHKKVQDMAGAEVRIIRFLDIRTTKEGAQHSSEMHELFAKAALEAGLPEEEDAEAEVVAQAPEPAAEAAA
ncbi:MAG: 30S ribosomal protein S6 [Patescibacteria group bacterium]